MADRKVTSRTAGREATRQALAVFGPPYGWSLSARRMDKSGGHAKSSTYSPGRWGFHQTSYSPADQSSAE
eukprot:7838213-Pyramimonas_sp.AAC.1